MLTGGILSGTAHQALTCTCVSHFLMIRSRMPAPRQAKHRSMPFAQLLRLSVPTRPRLPRGMRQSGRAGRAERRRLLKRREWRFLIERCCCSPALSKHSETHLRWLGMGPRQASAKNRTLSGRRIKPGAWPARSTRRSSSPSVAPRRPPRPWPEPCLARFGECATGNPLRCTATRPSTNWLVSRYVRTLKIGRVPRWPISQVMSPRCRGACLSPRACRR